MPSGLPRIEFLLSRPRVHLRGLESAVREVKDEARSRDDPALLESAASLLARDRRTTGMYVGELRLLASEIRSKLRRQQELVDQKAAFERDPTLIPEPRIETREAVTEVERLSPELIRHLQSSMDDLRHVEPSVFEHLVAEFFVAHKMFEEVALVGRDYRTSADVFAMSAIGRSGMEARVFVEIRRTMKPQGVNAIDQVLGAMLSEHEHGWTAGMIVSLGGFADTMKYSPRDLELRNLSLRNRTDLLRWLVDYEPTASGLYLPNPRRRLPGT